jgi:hypothetical protein
VLAERRAGWPWPVEVLDDLDQPQALEYLAGEERVAVMPSLVDNLPLAVLEALSLGVPFLTCPTGGIPELVDEQDHERTMVAPDPDELAAALRRALHDPPPPARFAVEPDANLDEHLRWHAAIASAEPAADAQPEADRTDLELVVSPRHRAGDEVRASLAAAATSSGADAVVAATRTGDGRVLVPLGGPVALGVVHDVFSTGTALVPSGTLGRHGDDPEVALYAGLAELALEGRRILVVAEPLLDETEPGRAAGVARAADLATAPPRLRPELDEPVAAVYRAAPAGALDELPALSRHLRDRLGDLAAAVQRSDALVRELAELRPRMVELAEAHEEIKVYEHRLTTLQNRKVVRIALWLADAVTRVVRR